MGNEALISGKRPLDGVRVLDLSRVLAGPYCGQLLADMGADVIKVESPDGDENRAWGTCTDDGMSCNFASVNRGKRGITLNLKSPAARNVLTELVRNADVVIQSFLPRVARKLGVDAEAVREINPRVIHCSISGYGKEGPLSEKPGYDLMMQAFSGMMSTTGYEGGPPVRLGVSIIDMSTGLTAYSGIMTALYARQQSGIATAVNVSLLESAVAMLGYHAVNWIEKGVTPQREGSGLLHLAPYQAFLCSDGYVLTGATNDAAWKRFCRAMGDESLTQDERFLTNDSRLQNRHELIALLEGKFITRTVAEWCAAFEEHGVAVSPLQTVDAVMSHPQVLANEMIVSATSASGRVAKLVGVPFKLDGFRGTASSAAPQLGQDTMDVLRSDLGMSDSQIDALYQEGAL